MKKFFAVLMIALVIGGCSGGTNIFNDHQHEQFTIEREIFVLRVEEDHELRTDGLAEWREGYCKIILKKYPICLKHEIRHCIEGHWHDERPNGEDCN